jgi:hypothetical protein
MRDLSDLLPPGQLDMVRRTLERHAGTLTTTDLKALALNTESTRRLLRSGALVSAGRAAFIDGERERAADANGRHVLRAIAIARTWPRDVLVSHTSAALMHELPLTKRPERVHGCRRLTGQHRRREHFTIHTGYPDATHTTMYGVDVIEPRFVIMGVAQLHGLDEAVVVGDAALRRKLVTRSSLLEAADRQQHHPVHATFVRAVDLMDARAESAGESRCRLVLDGLGYVAIPQVVVRDAFGAVLGRVDFLIEGTRVIIEFDGMVKYTSPETLVNEKRRELQLQRAGYLVVRLVWADLAQPARVRSLVEAAMVADRRAR